MTISLEAFIEAVKLLEAANVPLEDRKLAFIGKDGNDYILSKDSPEEVFNQLPDHMKWMVR